jgi:hypothetical protein
MECENCGDMGGRCYYSDSHYSFSAAKAFIPTWKDLFIELLTGYPFNHSSAVLCKKCLQYEKTKEEVSLKRLEEEERVEKLKFIKKRDSFMQQHSKGSLHKE